MNSNRILKAKIIERFGTQSDFGQSLGEDDTLISKVICGRRKLTKARAIVWLKALKCDPSILDAVTQKETINEVQK